MKQVLKFTQKTHTQYTSNKYCCCCTFIEDSIINVRNLKLKNLRSGCT